ncbi:MAG: hypothetical protein CMH54_04295 [Myxococcales bacterium]|nr:hypothetical protein [Myxococcales bacterium]
MNKISLTDFFSRVGYDWRRDEESLTTICYYTKSRVRDGEEEFHLTWGSEQPFAIKAIAEWRNTVGFFEIGTGRGTACYSVALLPSTEKIVTIDIVPHDKKKNEAIGFKPAFVSNADLYELVPFDQKEKIRFLLRKQMKQVVKAEPESFDVCFIDGNHSSKRVIHRDFVACEKLLKPGGLIIWDDYDPEKHKVKAVIEKVLKKDPSWNVLLLETRGGLFETETKGPETDAGMVLMSRRPFFD